MKTRLCRYGLVAIVFFAIVHIPFARAQSMPLEDVVDVPAMSAGLCVSNVFQSNMVVQRDKPIPDDKKQEPSDLRPGPIGNHNFPGNCYAGLIAPIAGLSINSAIFHQGYNNAFNGSAGAAMYRDVFPEMIKAWRNAFNDHDMPFGILSLCTEG